MTHNAALRVTHIKAWFWLVPVRFGSEP